MKSKILGLLALGLLAGPISANAVPVTWFLSGVTFEDGGIATGSFVFDADVQQVLSWNMATQGGSITPMAPGPNLYQSQLGGGVFILVPSRAFAFGAVGQPLLLRLAASDSLTNAGGTIVLGPLSPPGEIGFIDNMECRYCDPWRVIATGSLTTTSVPEPTAITLLGLGLAGLSLSRRRKANRASMP